MSLAHTVLRSTSQHTPAVATVSTITESNESELSVADSSRIASMQYGSTVDFQIVARFVLRALCKADLGRRPNDSTYLPTASYLQTYQCSF